MPRINNTQKYAILWLSSSGSTVQEISKELKITEKQVENVLNNSGDENKNNIKTKSKPVASSPSGNLMIKQTANKKNHVAIMTKEASMYNDAHKNKSDSSNTSKQQNIFKIKNNDE